MVGYGPKLKACCRRISRKQDRPAVDHPQREPPGILGYHGPVWQVACIGYLSETFDRRGPCVNDATGRDQPPELSVF